MNKMNFIKLLITLKYMLLIGFGLKISVLIIKVVVFAIELLRRKYKIVERANKCEEALLVP